MSSEREVDMISVGSGATSAVLHSKLRLLIKWLSGRTRKRVRKVRTVWVGLNIYLLDLWQTMLPFRFDERSFLLWHAMVSG
ncbi:hypothetical protein NEOLEDRAFT_1142418 [Neolentinus lepideus HHB14362 ss-1]|uniref:Uncharacterized protein n=1 Tax=Neolentinus lepideus HHB14362 ss-1 TaxID=1314782 RepID=A0A165N480_9AGAM|nr:hypothetical protein NEOLEDRAFT_1142418 [Neolentinus lepideus HHB14362 ss-1]